MRLTIDGEAVFMARPISDRATVLAAISARQAGLHQVPSHERLDMYWITVQLHIHDGQIVDLGAACVEPSVANPARYSVVRNHISDAVTPGQWPDLREQLAAWFRKQPEYIVQAARMQELRDAGYLLTGTPCPVCRRQFAAPGRHVHYLYDDYTYPYQPGGTYCGGLPILDQHARATTWTTTTILSPAGQRWLAETT